MTVPEEGRVDRVALSRSQQNIYNGVLQDNDPALYLIGKSYRFHPLELSGFLAGLQATILNNPVQLCVLEAPPEGGDYPELAPRLQFGDIVRVRSDDEDHTDRGDDEFTRMWSPDIIAKPLVRYTVRTDRSGYVSGLDVHTHHILLDGGATGIIETDLARHLAAGQEDEIPRVTNGLRKLAEAHRRESVKVEESLQRLAEVVRRELADEARHSGYGQGSNDAPGTAAKGVLHESARISGKAFDAILTFSEEKQVPLNVLVAAAAVAVDASLRQSTETLLVHAVDNRFGDADLNVATCLVNSVAHAVRFSPFASVADVVRILDRGYVMALRRRWFREEQYRRMYLAINRTSNVEALTLNFIREPCARGLRPFLSEAPVATDIGPVEGRTVACVLDEDQRTLNLAIWDRADLPERKTHPRVAERIAAALESMTAMWHNPIAMTVNEWFGIGPDGALRQDDWATQTEQPAPAWFLNPARGVDQFLEIRCYVYPWVAWLVQNGAVPGDVLVFTDDNTDMTIDLLIACHLAGCGYSVCDTVDELHLRADAIAAHSDGISTHVVNVAATGLAAVLDDELRKLVDGRIEKVTQDPLLATKTAYIMPTSGTTGPPKLVGISQGSLALFSDAVRRAYGWGPDDTILQCAPLTSDISVEEIFGGAGCGSNLVRSTAMKTGDLQALAHDFVAKRPTVIDLPTAVWHLLCDDGDALNAIRRSCLRQIVIGGEAIRPNAVDKWIESGASQGISVVSTYGPTETTVAVTYLPIACDGTTVAGRARLTLGRPLVPNTVFVAFGEVVIVGDLVSAGYLGIDSMSFGAVTATDGSRRRAFATADRVILDDNLDRGHPAFSGRKDAIVKISGKRVDTAEAVRRIFDDPAVSDVAVEPHEVGLGVWFETQRTREGAEDTAAAARIRRILVRLGVPSFFVVGVPSIPRKPNGKIDSDNLRTPSQFVDAVRNDAESGEKAAGLAEIWSRHLGRAIRSDSSLLDEGIGSLELIRILPETRRYLNRHLSLLDLISADSAANLAGSGSTADGWMDVETAAAIERDLASLGRRRRPPSELSVKRSPTSRRPQAIVVLGASGILGTGFAQAVLDLRRSGVPCPEVVLATRSQLPERDPWAALRSVDGVRIERLSPQFGPDDLDALIRDTGARTLINCIGNTNVLVPYRELRLANVELVSAITDACASRGTRLVQLSTFVVNGSVTAPRVTDPRDAPYPYAASKSLAELVVTGSPPTLDFTIVRLPRILGVDYQLRDSADILVSIVDACIALGAYPSVTLTEEVTTGRAATKAILGLLPELAGSAELGRGITVVHGAAVAYAEFLSGYALDELDAEEWKYRLDESDWATRNPRRWSVVDAWVGLGRRLGTRSYAEYLADYRTLALGIQSVAELVAKPESVRAVLAHGCSQ
ncbi:Plipastatin synthase subunit B [Mycobacterium simulans]|uniref:AMP-binding protein n=1 Tax=Mycobacterium simulans TaxID=627089 RepID=UPI0019C405DE|nr:AMP-binding protein [Mycobacterium simulans]SON61576.1 Plipastatin synthase subunit B [Mycobacterium simulans]